MERDEATAMARATLKKVLSGKGRLQGNFYFVADSAAKDVVLIATLASRDKKGTRAVNQGRPFRKEIKGAKFARGAITFQNGKMVFVVHKGNANKKSMTTGLRKVLSKEKGLAFLKQAVITTATATDEERQADESEGGEVSEEALAEASEGISETELSALEQQQGDLQNLSAFFSADDEELEAAYVAEVDEALKALKALQSSDDASPEAIADARAELAELVAVGKDNMPQLGEDLSPELMLVLTSASDLVGGDEDEDDLAAELLAGLQEATRRSLAIGEPEEIEGWLTRIEAMHDSGEYREGIAALESEVEWRLVRAERLAQVEGEIADAGERRRELARARVLWSAAHSRAAAELESVLSGIVAHPSVSASPQVKDIEKGLATIADQIPAMEPVEDALDAIVNAPPVEHAVLRDKALDALKTYSDALAGQDRLKRIDRTVFGNATVYSSLEDAVEELREILSSIES